MFCNIEVYIWKQIQIAACLFLGHIMVGYATGWTVPVVPKLQNPKETPLPEMISVTQASWVGSSFVLACVFGPHVSGSLLNIIGRKMCLLMAGCLALVGQIMLAFTRSLPLIFAGRLVTGGGLSMIAVTNLVYIGEIASSDMRGVILTSTGIFHVFGSLIVYSVGPFVSYAAIGYLAIGICILYLVCTLTIPESPVYHILKGNEKAAKNTLIYLGRGQTINEEIAAMNENTNIKQETKSNWKELFTVKTNRKSLFITVSLVTFQLWSGTVAGAFFMTTIFQRAGSSIEPAFATIIVGITQFCGASLVPILIERAGRKTLLLISTCGCCLSMTVLGVYFYLDQINHPSIDFIGWLPLATMIFDFICYSIGLNIVPNTLVGEVFRSNVRGIGSSVAMTAGQLMGVLSITTFGYLIEAIGNAYTFWIYAVIDAIGLVFTLLVVPETKGKTLTEIENILSH